MRNDTKPWERSASLPARFNNALCSFPRGLPHKTRRPEALRSQGLLKLIIALSLVFCSAAAQVSGQRTAQLKVSVLDPSGAAVTMARVLLKEAGGGGSTLAANSRGEVTFAGLTLSTVQIHIEAAGFEPLDVEIKLRAGDNRREFKLAVARVRDELTVKRDEREKKTDPREAALTTILTEAQIAQLPDDPDEMEKVLRAMAGPGASIRVNGFRGGKLPPKSRIRQIRFRQTPYSAEDHDEGFGLIEIMTKPGSTEYHGSLGFGFLDEALNARNAFAPRRGPEQLRRLDFMLDGPIFKNRTSFFVWGGSNVNYDSKTIVAALPEGTFASQVLRPSRSLNLTARIEHALTKLHSLSGEYQRNGSRHENQNVGDFDLPERAYFSRQTEHLVRISESGPLAQKYFNELRTQVRWQENDVRSLSDQPAILVLNAFNRGGAGRQSNRKLRELEVVDNFDFALRQHGLRTGFQLEAASYRSSDRQNANGTFTFASLKAFRAGRPTTYSQRTGEAAIELSQVQFGTFLQDDWRVRKNLSLSFGLRYETQTNLADANNFAPRMGVAWSPFKNGKTTVRGGAGIFFSWFGAEVYEQTLRVNGRQQQETVILNPGFPNPFGGGTLGEGNSLPPGRLQQDSRMNMPYYNRASVSVEQNLAGKFMLMADFRAQRGVHLLRSRNLNAPLNGVRPFPTEGNIVQIESSANASMRALNIGLGPGFGKVSPRLFWFVNYMLAKATSDTDGALAQPADNYNLRAERGPAAEDIRHRFSAMLQTRLAWGFRLGSFFNASSAAPYNITTGFDDNSDANSNDRPAGVGRNSARGAGQWDASARLGWQRGFGRRDQGAAGGGVMVSQRIGAGGPSGPPGGGGPMMSIGGGPGGELKRYHLEFYLQAYNLLNRTNPFNFSGVITSPFFGQPTAAHPGRRIESGIRLGF